MAERRERSAGRRGRRRRLSRSAEFDRVFREGRSHANRYLVLHAFPRGTGEAGASASDAAARPGAPDGPRLGVSVGRRVGGAVERNRVKRLLREAFWRLAPDLPAGHDFVIVARPETGDLARARGEAGVEESLREVLGRAGLSGGEPR